VDHIFRFAVVRYRDSEIQVSGESGYCPDETARPPIRAQCAPIAFRSAVALRSADSTDVTASFPRGQAKPTASWRLGEPGCYHAVDVGPASLWVLAMHPLPIELDAKFMHFQGGLQAFCLRYLLLPWVDRSRPTLTEARHDVPGCLVGAPDTSTHIPSSASGDVAQIQLA
jgi:hypothetical protein